MNASLTRHRNLLLGYLKPLRLRVGLLAALLIGGIGLELLNPQILRGFIDSAAQGGAAGQLTRAALLFIGEEMRELWAGEVAEAVGPEVVES